MRANPCRRLLAPAAVAIALAVPGLGVAAPPELRLIDAVKKADRAAVDTLLQQRIDVNAKDVDGATALHWAVHRDDVPTVQLILRAGADAKAANRYGVTPLSLACVNGNAAIIEVLIDAGADPNTASSEGETALMSAARTGNAAAVKTLIARGANVNAKETLRGQTALMWAVAERHLDAARALIEAGADVKAKSATKGFTPFLFAVRGGDFDLVKMMLAAGVDVNEAGSDGTPALYIAIVNAHFELAEFLLEQGADPNVSAPGGTALHALVRTRDYEYGKVVRPAAVQTGKVDALDLLTVLLDYGADPDARIVKPLPRQGGFDNNYLKLNGATPFLLAARAGDPTVMRLLAEYGADPLRMTDEKVTPLMVGAGMGYVQGQSIGTDVGRFEAVKLALELGVDINATSDSGETAMHGAATGGVNAVVQLLVDKGAKLDTKAKDGHTPLAIADGTKSAFRAWPHTAALIRKLLDERGETERSSPDAASKPAGPPR